MESISSKPSAIEIVNELEFTEKEYYVLYNFFVTYSLCKSQSKKIRKISDYGWKRNSTLKNEIKKIITFEKGVFDISKKDSLLSNELVNYDLIDNKIFDISWERGLFAHIDSESEPLFIMFYYIRNSLAHGDYTIRKDEKNEKILVMQSSFGKSIKARMVIKLKTIFELIKLIDKNNILIKEE